MCGIQSDDEARVSNDKNSNDRTRDMPRPLKLNGRLGFPFVDQDVISELRHEFWKLFEIVIGSICRYDIYKPYDAVVLTEKVVRPVKNQLLGVTAPEPGDIYRYRNKVPWTRKLDLADHFFLHLPRILLRFHQAVSINISSRGMSA